MKSPQYWEEKAEIFLREHGLIPVCRRYRCRWGEIDLIMKEKDKLVFVEVKFRSSQRYGSALESISRHKLSRLRKTAIHFLANSKSSAETYRFDVVGIENGRIHWLKGVM